MTAPPVKVRLRLFWEAAKAARGRAPDEELQRAFVERARISGLIAALDAVTRRHGQETVEHVLRWALRNRNPWRSGEFPDD